MRAAVICSNSIRRTASTCLLGIEGKNMGDNTCLYRKPHPCPYRKPHPALKYLRLEGSSAILLDRPAHPFSMVCFTFMALVSALFWLIRSLIAPRTSLVRETANNARGLEVGLLSLTESYRPREIRFLDLWELPGWRAKVYGIAHHSRVMPDGAMAGHVRAMALDRLSSLEINQHYGLAVIIIHMARETDIVSITWWTWENVLEQALFIGPPGEPARLKDVTGQGSLRACGSFKSIISKVSPG